MLSVLLVSVVMVYTMFSHLVFARMILPFVAYCVFHRLADCDSVWIVDRFLPVLLPYIHCVDCRECVECLLDLIMSFFRVE